MGVEIWVVNCCIVYPTSEFNSDYSTYLSESGLDLGNFRPQGKNVCTEHNVGFAELSSIDVFYLRYSRMPWM